MQSPSNRLTQAREAYRLADQAEQEAWGPTDGYHAKPQAVQLAARIAVGEELLRRSPGAAGIQHGLEVLWAALERAKADAADQERCRVWREAYEAWLVALHNVVRAKELEDGETNSQAALGL